MAAPEVQYLSSGDTALTVQFGTVIERELNSRIVALGHSIAKAAIPGVSETLPTYRSLLVNYDPLVLSRDQLVAQLQPLVDSPPDADDTAPARWQVPVCFDSDLAPDLAHVAAASGMSEAQVIKAMLDVTHHVYMLGFAPGQPYMGDLPPALNIPRRENPVPRVEKGSVATATGLTIIYAVPNPTGWHVVGRTPVEIFDLAREEPILFKPGDKVNLRRIVRDEFDALSEQVDEGSFDMAGLRQP